MRNLFRLMTLAAAFAFMQMSAPAIAQQTEQIQLTAKQMENYIAAQKDILAITEKVKDADADKPNPKVEAEIQAAVKKNGFSSFDEYTTVADNVSLILSGIDPETKQFSEPKAAIQKDIAEVQADKEMKPEEKKQVLAELQEALKSAEPVKFPGNVALVKKYYDQLDKGSQ
jgi:hypothetical protein